MNIGLIALSGIRVHHPMLASLGVNLPGFVRRGKVIASLPSLGLLTVAGLTPKEHHVSYLEIQDKSQLHDLPPFDLVGISSLSAQIELAYEVSTLYRNRGTTTVMGGLHVSAVPEEALGYCDSVIVGGAEGAWPRLLTDFSHGRIQNRYHGMSAGMFKPEHLVMPRFDLLSGRDYNRVTIQTSRGCPRNCEFCGASRLITSQFNQKPVEHVAAEIREAKKHFKHPFFELADDNTFLNRTWGRKLLHVLQEAEIKWFTETDVSIGDDPEFCKWLAPAGCRQILIGMESPRASDLRGLDPKNWKQSQADEYRRLIDLLQSSGVSVNGCFILGLDDHSTDIFPLVLDFVRETGMAEAQFTVMTPFPGTELFARLKREGRLLRDRFWEQCTLFDVTYKPARMSVEELEAGLRWLFAQVYSAEGERARRRSFTRKAKGKTDSPS